MTPRKQQHVLIVCTGNSCRSILAEAIWRHLAGDRYCVQSAGTHPQGVHPFTLRVLEERGVSTAGLRSKSLREVDTRHIDLLITVCDQAQEHCPVVPINCQHLHWPFEDPASFSGSDEERLEVFRKVRDAIWARVADFLRQHQS